jgi:hypothetical protein
MSCPFGSRCALGKSRGIYIPPGKQTDLGLEIASFEKSSGRLTRKSPQVFPNSKCFATQPNRCDAVLELNEESKHG